MNILIFNCGSSSQGFKVYQVTQNDQPEICACGKAKNVATQTRAGAVIEWDIQGVTGSKLLDLSSHRQAALNIIAILKENCITIDAIGHRFVHGGRLFDHTVLLNDEIMEKLRECLHFAPIHNPNTYSVIEVCQEYLPGVSQFAVFDTAFHAGMPEASRQYAIPRDLAEKHGFRKYGFHGLSCQYVSAKTAECIGKPLESLKLILCHLGAGGSSVTAIRGGKSLDSSMGYSTLPGLVMSTRCGDLDPEIVLEMIRSGNSLDEISGILYNQSGLIGLSGFSSNLFEIIEESEKGNASCRLAYEVYAQRLKIYLGAFTWLLDGADAIVFTDDVGVKCWKLREEVCSGVENLGVEIDPGVNRQAPVNKACLVSSSTSGTQIWVVPTDEEIVILREVLARMSEPENGALC